MEVQVKMVQKVHLEEEAQLVLQAFLENLDLKVKMDQKEEGVIQD